MKKTNLDGMRYPAIDDLLKAVDSKYKLAYVAAKVAKLIRKYGDELKITNSLCYKPVGIALEELLAGHIKIEFKDLF